MASSTPRENRSFFLAHTNWISKVCVFVFIQNASIDSRPHYRFGAFSTVRTETFENKRLARCDVCWTLSCRRIPTASDKHCWDTSTQRCFFHFWPVSWSSQCWLSHLALPNLADQHWEGKKMANCPKNFYWDCTGYFVFLHLFKRFTTMGTHIRSLIYQVSFFIFFYCLFMASMNKTVILSYLVIPNFPLWNEKSLSYYKKRYW